MFDAYDAGDVLGQRITGERAGRDDAGAFGRDPIHFHFHDLDPWLGPEELGHFLTEALAIDGQCTARRNASPLGDLHHAGSESPHLLFQEADGVGEGGASKRVRAHELAQPIARLSRGPGLGFLLEQANVDPATRQEQCRFGAGEPGADDHDMGHGWTEGASRSALRVPVSVVLSEEIASTGLSSSMPREYPHSLPRPHTMRFCFPPASTRNGCLQIGQGSSMGFCQSLKSHWGYFVQP